MDESDEILLTFHNIDPCLALLLYLSTTVSVERQKILQAVRVCTHTMALTLFYYRIVLKKNKKLFKTFYSAVLHLLYKLTVIFQPQILLVVKHQFKMVSHHTDATSGTVLPFYLKSGLLTFLHCKFSVNAFSTYLFASPLLSHCPYLFFYPCSFYCLYWPFPSMFCLFPLPFFALSPHKMSLFCWFFFLLFQSCTG